jgi:hypothetical protein
VHVRPSGQQRPYDHCVRRRPDSARPGLAFKVRRSAFVTRPGLLSSTERSCNTEGVSDAVLRLRGFVRMFRNARDLRHVDQGWRCATPTSDF